MRIVIAGSGIAALWARDAVLSTGVPADVTMISRDTEAPYSKVALPKYVSGQIGRDSVFLRVAAKKPAGAGTGRQDPAWLRGTSLISIDRAAHTVATAGPSGHGQVPYDRLILALGATPCGRFGLPFWTLDDADQIKALAAAGKTVAIAGGGFVGLRLATALPRTGMKVTVFEREEHVMPGRIPPRFADCLEDTLGRAGVEVRTHVVMDSLERIADGWEVRLESPGHVHETLKFDLAVDCTGTFPSTTLATNAGLDISARGILVDQCQRTSDPDILAAGDCAAVTHTSGELRSAGVWHQASAQGRVAGLVAVGAPVQSPPSTGWHTFEIPDPENLCGATVELGQTGPVPRVACSFGDLVPLETDRILESGDPAGDSYRYAVLREGLVSGYFTTAGPSELGGLIERLGKLDVRLEEISTAWYPSPFSIIAGPETLPVGPGNAKVTVKGRLE